ncbi:uncharacterized protein JCM6883_003196 [Sporobolomyces salmoneus]|uniref:uncharacterized protein n=1 Tax=Sporobolomyces salmoneus TaxID=183962 RepID=UPI00317ADA80
MTTTPFSFEPPAASKSQPESPFSSLFSSHLSSTSDATLSTLSKLSQALLEHRTKKEIEKEMEQLQGELRSEYKPRLKAIKADFFARMVWNEGQQTDASSDEDAANGGEPLAGDVAEEEEEKRYENPTIISDSDAQTEMSAAVDQAAEKEITKNLEEAREKVEPGLRARETLKLEIWLSQTILDAYEVSTGEEVGAARYVQDQLEDTLFEAGIDSTAVLQSPSATS